MTDPRLAILHKRGIKGEDARTSLQAFDYALSTSKWSDIRAEAQLRARWGDRLDYLTSERDRTHPLLDRVARLGIPDARRTRTARWRSVYGTNHSPQVRLRLQMHAMRSQAMTKRERAWQNAGIIAIFASVIIIAWSTVHLIATAAW